MMEQMELQEEVARLRTRVTELEAGTGLRRSRRQALRRAGAAAVGGAAALLTSGEAGATTGTMQYGVSQDAGGAITSLTSSAGTTFSGYNTGSGGTGVLGAATSSGTGVLGKIDNSASNGYGVWGMSTNGHGFGLVASGGSSQLLLDATNVTGPSQNLNAHLVGEVAFDVSTQAMWACVTAGTPGGWRKLASPATAGSLHAITPSRVYDSRISDGVLATGNNRSIFVAHQVSPTSVLNVVPSGATAIAYNLTITNTVGANGYLCVNPGLDTSANASAINWFGSNQKAANGSVVKISSGRVITVVCGGTSTSTHFIIDVVGYYL